MHAYSPVASSHNSTCSQKICGLDERGIDDAMIRASNQHLSASLQSSKIYFPIIIYNLSDHAHFFDIYISAYCAGE